MLKNVLGFHRIRVDDVMVPRADIVAVAGRHEPRRAPRRCSAPPAIRACRSTARRSTTRRAWSTSATSSTSSPPGPTTAPRAGGEREDAGAAPPSLGGVDLSMTLAAAKILRPVLFVPRSMPAVDLLVRMQATRTHMALVIDEYGGTDGLVSIEDLVEMVVGDIEDEHDDAAARMIVRGDDDTFVADARASLDEVTEASGSTSPPRTAPRTSTRSAASSSPWPAACRRAAS